ncbi:MAG: Do family serine endopeptidase [Bacteroidetes bacterium]|jgi:Do/DeqQ family serine protease|nr:Do family serine endopeptidase [Bacteroidota bacterium]
MRKFGILVAVALLASAATLATYEMFGLGQKEVVVERVEPTPSFRLVDNSPVTAPMDFTAAAELSTPAVVHIVATTVSTLNTYDPWREFFGDDFFGAPQNPRERRQESSGSGVIISPDGYVVTNNHVVANAEEVEITLYNKESYTATIVGTDPTTDLALLKIEVENATPLSFANSDEVRVGEWVLAVGNPFNLESTVTAGIVSAKGRNINILQEQYSIESFIQTDAAVNPGNSGGALVDLQGNLIGINTAIATPTGVYAGYSFAVPSNIVKKVCEDIKKYGLVQRGFLGVMIRGVDSKLAAEKGLKVSSGVYVDEVVPDGAADKAGIKSGDVIVRIQGVNITAVPELQEQVGSKRPGDELSVVVNRNGSDKEITVQLKNKDGETGIVEKSELTALDALGIEIEDLESGELSKLGIPSGVKVTTVNDGMLRRYTKIREGFIITKIDDKPMASAQAVEDYLAKKQTGKGMMEGFYPGLPGKVYYGYSLE